VQIFFRGFGLTGNLSAVFWDSGQVPDIFSGGSRMEKEITVKQFSDELISRIDDSKNIDCCKIEIKRLAEMAKKEMPDKKIKVLWKD